jgi:hypothetical protein
MASLEDTLKQLILQYVANVANPTLPLLNRAFESSFSADEVSKAVNELVADKKLKVSGKLENIGGELKAIVHLQI